ncbi:MAG: polysaccharide deacetylase family protein [Clostridia bacterium]|nr:polysaccharide deacetylase family protein [Clostridia bacterium]
MRKLLTVLALALLLGAAGVRADGNREVYFSCAAGEGKKIALTFDDGPHPVYTKEILEILEEYGIRATFFVIGVNAERWPELVREELAAGHEIGNHTYAHANLQKETYETVRGEILNAEEILTDCTARRPHLLRPPGGLYCDAVGKAAEELDYTVILWSVDPRDWAHTAVEEIVENVLTNTDSGDILLFHDYVSGQSPTPEALRRILPVLIERGYEFVTVSELLGGTVETDS